jgi:hypothetical protein
LIDGFTNSKLTTVEGKPKLMELSQTQPTILSQFKDYRRNKQKLLNIGIARLLDNPARNEELERYLAEKSYESASLGETSADEVTMLSGSESAELEVYRESAVASAYDEAKEIAAKVDMYE